MKRFWYWFWDIGILYLLLILWFPLMVWWLVEFQRRFG